MIVRAYDSGFPQSDETFNGMGCGSDGRIYYALSSKAIDVGAQLFCYDPARDEIQRLGDLTEAAGEAGIRAIPQGKVHVPLVESAGRLYFATHLDYYEIRDGRETFSTQPPGGYRPYPGGHFLSYDPATRRFEDLGRDPGGEGIVTMSGDPVRRRLYALTWPSGRFLRCDVDSRGLRDLGPVQEGGETWPSRGGPNRPILRAIAGVTQERTANLTRADGGIFRYRPADESIERLESEDLRKDYFGNYEPSAPGSMGYNWRQMVWYPPERVFYGVHGNSGYLFRFDPRAPAVELVERITSEPSRRSGMADQFTYGYLGFALAPDARTLCYLTGGPIFVDGRRLRGDPGINFGARGRENFHLVTYDLAARRYRDHGPILLPDGQRPGEINALALGRDGAAYTLGRIVEHGRARTDLIRISWRD